MIIHARVDERLIHGQVATVWTNTTGANRIAVVNDIAVKDELQIAALKMAKPPGIKLSILSLARATEHLSSDKYEDDKVFVITKTIRDMKKLIDAGVPISKFNVGNISASEGSKAIKRSVSLTEKDIADINELLSKGIEITAQMVPSESDASIATFLG